jgi:hypothetical protein
MARQKHIGASWRKMVCGLFFLCMATSVFATGPSNVISYHWQPTEQTSFGYNPYPPVGYSRYTINISALVSAGSYSPLTLLTGAGDTSIWRKEDSTALWLDTAADGKRYIAHLADQPYAFAFEDTSSMLTENQTLFAVIRILTNNPRLQLIKTRRDRSSFAVNATIFADSIQLRDILHNKPLKTQPVNLHPYITNKTWVPFFLRDEDINADTLGISVGIADSTFIYVKCPKVTSTSGAI